jgi:phosphohistidine swiveling domain-containing protein
MTGGADTHQDSAGRRWENPVPGALWLRAWRLGEWLQAPVSPLFETFLLPILARARQNAGSGRLGWRLPRSWYAKEPSYAIIDGYYYARVDPDTLSLVSLPFRFIYGEVRGGWLPRWQERCLPEYTARLDEYHSTDLRATSGDDLLHMLHGLAQDVAELWHALALSSGGIIPLQRVLEKAFWPAIRNKIEGDPGMLLSGFPTEILEEQESLYSLAQEAASSPAVSEWLEEHALGELDAAELCDGELSTFRRRFRAHLEKYGHQVPSLDFVFPCLAEEPGQLSVALRCYMDPWARSPGEIVEQTKAEREAATRALSDALRPVKRALFSSILRRAQNYAVARERIVFFLQMGWPVFRKLLLELGNRLSRAATIEHAADVFFLTSEELTRHCSAPGRGESLTTAVSERRRLWQERNALRAPVSIPPADDGAWQKAMRWPINLREIGVKIVGNKSVLIGTAASPGRVRARARVLGFPSEFDRLAQGEVLVAVATTPSWTPLFSKASAVVTDAGAVSSHSSVVAREYRIPAVVGTQQATQLIKDGQFVVVDGTAGKVYLE